MGSDQNAYRAATLKRISWCPFAKGGAFSPFYQDLTLVVRWTDDGYEIRNFADPDTGYVFSRYRGAERYFDAGFTYADRAATRFAPRALPEGAVISVKGSGIYCGPETLAWPVLAILNSTPFTKLMDLLLGRVQLAKSYQVNTVGRVPWPLLTTTTEQELSSVAREGWQSAFLLDRSQSTSHAFVQPILTSQSGSSLVARQSQAATSIRNAEDRLMDIQQTIDRIAIAAYGLSESEFAAIEEGSVATDLGDVAGDNEESSVSTDLAAVTAELVDWTCGVVFGRWDIRFATIEKTTPDLPDPFAPLPVCPPGMLQNEQGLPSTEDDVRRVRSAGQWHYPIEIHGMAS